MKAIINGKTYDTDTAERIAKGPCVSVYRTINGNWFVKALSIDRNVYEIRLLDTDEAKRLIGLHAPEKYTEYFGKTEEV